MLFFVTATDDYIAPWRSPETNERTQKVLDYLNSLPKHKEKPFYDFNEVEDLESLQDLFGHELILDFSTKPYPTIEIYNGWIE